ncbi:Ribosomal protein S18 acetylase RimI [Sinosporangium album]|uniref:Ribosomal protein S18 acetylase RimI n=1 Tax=Sinosporangium album TaxID=504805 RepID=A0A1G7T7J3_9ACTN|nr:GNAT family N-acetyltransferase [Sinosporangium album]SDG31042.1 Ribosomal protein S18 acetylase RimI [Sinosporangium album]
MSLTVRRYHSSDLPAVQVMHRLCLAQVGLAPGDGVYYDDDFPRIHQIYIADRGEFLVGESAGRVVAMGALRRIDEERAEICRMRVHPDFQRRRFGTEILRRLEERAVELGYRRIRVDTTLNQAAALALYRKFGWVETGRELVGGLIVVYGEKVIGPAFGAGHGPV